AGAARRAGAGASRPRARRSRGGPRLQARERARRNGDQVADLPRRYRRRHQRRRISDDGRLEPCAGGGGDRVNIDDTVVPYPAEFAARYRERGYWTGTTHDILLREAASEAPDRVAIVDERTRWTYAELDARVGACAAGLAAYGLRAGDRCVVQLPNIAEFVQIVFA